MNYKKLLYGVLFSGLTLQAANSQYLGVILEGGYGLVEQENSKTANVNVDPVVYGGKLNLGIDSGEDLRTNIFFGLQYFDNDIYNYEVTKGTSLGSSSQFLYSVGFDIIKTYSEKGSSILPYMKGGMDYEFMSLEGYAQSWASNVGLTFGGGTFIRTSDMLELQMGLYYKYRMWGDYNLDTPLTQNVELSDHSLMLELGLNFHY